MAQQADGPAPATEEGRGRPGTPVVVLVGFDGSGPARRALESATRLLEGRGGWLEIVYVAHVPAASALSPMCLGEVMGGLDDIEYELGLELSKRLDPAGVRWHFQRRDGEVAQELIKAAGDLDRRYGPQATIVLVVGGSSHRIHRLVGSVSSHLERVDRYPVVVVP